MTVNSKAFWGYIRERTKSRSGISELKDSNGIIVDSDSGKANLLNEFFASVFVEEPTGLLPIFDTRYNDTPVSKLVVDSETVLKQLRNLNVNKSMGPDACHPRILHEACEQLSDPLCKIFNKSFETGDVPTLWKEANISALYKNKGEKSDPSNYRPVSLTCVPSKLCEKSVRNVIMQHMKANKLFSNIQFGFREKRSCILQLLDVLDDFVKNFDVSLQTDAVYLDIKKAFDSVPHRRLILKMKSYGFKDEILRWVANFLSGRRQHVVQ